MTALRVLSYNIRGGLGMDEKRDTARIASVLDAQHADIICLQEVHQNLPWSHWINQPARLGRALQMPVCFAKAFSTPFGGYGIAIATHLPVTRVQCHKLPGTGEKRIALQARIIWNDAPLSIFCTHWGLSETDRLAQANTLANAINAGTHPIIVCGDFNETAGKPAVQLLLQKGNLRDAGAAENLPTYPADTPRARIDLILHTPELHCQRIVTVPTLASDHVPVAADFVSETIPVSPAER